MKVKFQQWSCIAVGLHYGNRRKAIELVDVEDGEPIAIATVNLPHSKVKTLNHVFIKDYTENEGMTDSLLAAGIIKPNPVSSVQPSFVNVYQYELTVDALELWGQSDPSIDPREPEEKNGED